ncbi:nitric-oxide reductase large subunit [Arcticibacter tournemirensis]|uniref:Nitric-oxide reductase large subunit n=1 Tax=Arcticibacter tournemirensis TaxID=699437 RepID=A0A4Q0MB07_9SPHI|nr:nitric-oxide reductase large subunit [Arcticibacter tournemirensis]RXF70457.1 nitric-oxide reductase large subunit [Arcticibacter tournemirensis]
MKNPRKLWLAFAIVVGLSFAVLGYYGIEIYQKAPPIPEKVVSGDEVLFSGEDIKDGQNVWQSIGGQEVGSIWGHGAYAAPDWTADWIHREAKYMLDHQATKRFNNVFDKLNDEQKAALQTTLQKEIRKNTFDEAQGTITLSAERAMAYKQLEQYYSGLFSDDPAFNDLREAYAIPKNTIKDPVRLKKISAFFFWASWACVTNRPGENVSYTHNWPSERLVGNVATGDLMLWTGFSVIMLLLGIGILVFYNAKNKEEEVADDIPTEDPLLQIKSTPSMRATLKYFWIVTALILVQVILGVVTAHFGVEGSAFYGIPLDEVLPYSLSRTWHVQLAIFWIATSWLATGLYIAPAVSGYEPKYQTLGVNFLFIALLIIVAGSMGGQWMAIMQRLGYIENFWFGHQGYEYVDLGRFWQIFLLIGLFLWLGLMVRALLPALRQKTSSRNLLIMFIISSVAIALFYGAGLMWGRRTNLAIAEYWRWWVVHLWVEGFFEVFATVVAAFLFTRMKLLNERTATLNVLFSTIIFLSGGIIGTFHHLYFSGTPTAVLALGATFSALEVVPLVIIGIEAYHNYSISKLKPWVNAYKWPIYCLVAVAFWNFLGAGIFGFIINPPIALYYMQGLNTTPVHAHTALFGVYGILGIGLMLFVLKGLYRQNVWKDGLIGFSFWSINIGLLLMVLISVLPIGLLQTVASVNEGMWYARSAEFMQQPIMNTLRWLRVIGDTIFAFGTIGLALFVIGLKTGWSYHKGDFDVKKTEQLH